MKLLSRVRGHVVINAAFGPQSRQCSAGSVSGGGGGRSIVLIDAENQRAAWAKTAIERARAAGEVRAVRAFGDFRVADGAYAGLCMDEGIFCEQVFSVPRKNATDFHVCIYAMEALAASAGSEWDTLVLVSGDGDFIPLVHHLRRKNKKVVGVAEHANGHLVRACDEFVHAIKREGRTKRNYTMYQK